MIDSALLELAAAQGRDASVGAVVLIVVCGVGVALAVLIGALAVVAMVSR